MQFLLHDGGFVFVSRLYREVQMLRKAIMLGGLLAVAAVCQQAPQRPSTAAPNREGPCKELVIINQAATIYFSWLKRLPTSLKQLGHGGGKADMNAADLIPNDLASGSYNGYSFTLSATKAGWIVQAVPLSGSKGDIQTTFTIESRIPQGTYNRR
jgi:hypothetical protein